MRLLARRGRAIGPVVKVIAFPLLVQAAEAVCVGQGINKRLRPVNAGIAVAAG